MLITKEIQIDAGHRIPNHNSKCKNIHGHRYVLEIGVLDKIKVEKGTSQEGMVIDFADLKKILLEQIDSKFDHSLILFDGDPLRRYFEEMVSKKLLDSNHIHFVPFIPTVENLTEYWFKLIQPELQHKNIKLQYLKVWETPTSSATYTFNDHN